MIGLKFLLLIQVLFIPMAVYTQQDEQTEPDFSNYLEAVSDPGLEEITDEVYESLVQWYRHPINLNTATREDLLALLLLDEQEVTQILQYRQQYGNFLSFRELYLVEGLDSVKISAVKDFLTVGSASGFEQDTIPFLRRISRFSEGSIILRYGRLIEKRHGYRNRNDPVAVSESRYFLGSPDQVNIRFNLEVPGDFIMGFTAEKDPGEKIFFAAESYGFGFDHYAGYFRKQFKSWLRSITAGDFQLQTGQGVVMGNGLFVGKGTEPIGTTTRHDHGVKPFQGSAEYGFFRGLAIDMGGRRWSATAFVSRKGMDATVEILPDPAASGLIRSLIRTGYHRTPQELSRKNAVFMYTTGFKGSYNSLYHNLTVGISGIWNRLNLPVHENPNYYNTFDFSGKENFNLGLNHNYYKGKFNIFGEVAFSGRGGAGIVQGIIANLGSWVETALHFRYYDKNYFSFTGRAFGEYAVNNNEQGLYWGLKIFPLPRLHVNFYYDLFRSDWFRYGTAAPGTGNEWMMSVNLTAAKFSNFIIYFHMEKKPRNLPAGNGHEYIVSETARNKWRLIYKYDRPGGLFFTSRVQGSNYFADPSKSSGFVLIQDAGYRFTRGYIKARIVYFRAEDYETRQYVYEPDVLYSYSSSVYYGRGMRYMLLLKFRPSTRLDCWFKLGRYAYAGEESLGSGLDTISGNKKTEIRCQIQFKF